MTIYGNRQTKESSACIPFNLPNTQPGHASEPLDASWFNTIPPERIGLNGEYDYQGLQKRVDKAFQEHAGVLYQGQLAVEQRGRVVVLSGQVRDKEILWDLIAIAQGIKGVSRVEVASVIFGVPATPSS